MAACRAGDTLVVTKLDRLARSVPDARDIVDELTAAGVKLNIGGSIHDPTDPIGRLLFTTLSMIAEFEATWPVPEPEKGWPSPGPKDDYAANSPNSAPVKKPTWSSSTVPAGAPSAN